METHEHAEHLETPEAVKSAIRRAVAENGFYVLTIFGDNAPSFAYTIGLYRTYGHPELIMVGDLPVETLSQVVLSFCRRVQAGTKYEAGQEEETLAPGTRHVFLPVLSEQYLDYVGQAMNYYGGMPIFPVLQVVWPNEKGLLPWESEDPQDRYVRQPLLGPAPGEDAEDDDLILDPMVDVVALRTAHDGSWGEKCAIAIFSDGEHWRVGEIHPDVDGAFDALLEQATGATPGDSLGDTVWQLDLHIAMLHPSPQTFDMPELDELIAERRVKQLDSEEVSNPYCAAILRKGGKWDCAVLFRDTAVVEMIRQRAQSWPEVSSPVVSVHGVSVLASILLDPDFPSLASREALHTALDVSLYEAGNWHLDKAADAGDSSAGSRSATS